MHSSVLRSALKHYLEVERCVVYSHDPELLSIFLEAYEKEWVKEFSVIVDALEYLTE